MNRFFVGFLVGALFMYWLISQSPQLLAGFTGWLNETSHHYSGISNTSPAPQIR